MGSIHEFLDGIRDKAVPAPFRQLAWYRRGADTLECRFHPDPYIAKRHDELVTVFLAAADRSKVVGFAVRNFVRNFGQYAIGQRLTCRVRWKFAPDEMTIKLDVLGNGARTELTFTRPGKLPANLRDIPDAEMELTAEPALAGA